MGEECGSVFEIQRNVSVGCEVASTVKRVFSRRVFSHCRVGPSSNERLINVDFKNLSKTQRTTLSKIDNVKINEKVNIIELNETQDTAENQIQEISSTLKQSSDNVKLLDVRDMNCPKASSHYMFKDHRYMEAPRNLKMKLQKHAVEEMTE